jgi:primosomal protein N' (replication factor Y)
LIVAIVRVALPVAAHQLFDYWLPAGLAPDPGSVLVVRLGRRLLHGVAVEVVESSEVAPERLMPIDELVTDVPAIPADLLELASFVSTYYQEPIGLCLAQMLPPLTVGSRRREALPEPPMESTAHAALPSAPALNPDQRAALDAAVAELFAFRPSLLQGVTGSGKTEVYLAAAARVIEAGRQALLLVPEINLTPQLEQRIAQALPNVRVGALHSRLGALERRTRWLAAGRAEIQLLVGTRLAVFAPLPRLGLIVVDEEHDPSFKQQDGVRYHARDVAIFRAQLRGVPIILGRALPARSFPAKVSRCRG